MPNKPDYRITINTPDHEAISLASIVENPRGIKPQDVLAASKNLAIVVEDTNMPASIEAAACYLFKEFFVTAHRTGLYNRQKNLWESLSRAATIEVYQLTAGILNKKSLPAYDAVILDQRGRPIILMRLIEAEGNYDPKFFEATFKSLVQKVQSDPGLINGLFLCLPKPFPETLLSSITKLIGAKDPVGRYESKLPQPLSIPIDLLEIDKDANDNCAVNLVHPDLTPKRQLRKGLLSVTEQNH
jgi:hypothetical protein